MFKRIFLVQTCICLIITGAYFITDKAGSEDLKDDRSKIVAAMSKHNTIRDVIINSRETVAAALKVPSTVTSYIIDLQDADAYDPPVDETAPGETSSVYAVYGGQIIETGSNEDVGKYIKIRHDGKISHYGNCCKIYVKEGEHVRKGQVIATYTNQGNEEFYYDLIEE